MTLLVVMGLLAVLSIGAAYSLTFITTESRIQADQRRSKEAFFAAEAGLAEGREAARLWAGTSGTWTTTYAAIANVTGAVGTGGADVWFELLPDIPYRFTLATGTPASAAIDDAVAAGNRGLRDETAAQFRSFPQNNEVSYRVFMRDDFDDADQATDGNGRAWIVSVGEIRRGGDVLARSVVQALVMPDGAPPLLQQGPAQRGGGASKDFANSFDSAAPDLAAGSTTVH